MREGGGRRCEGGREGGGVREGKEKEGRGSRREEGRRGRGKWRKRRIYVILGKHHQTTHLRLIRTLLD